jgi:alpha-mannosidase
MDKKRRKTPEKNDNMDSVIKRKNQHKHLTVHIVAHTHDDVGWLKTYEEYYTGMRGQAAHARVGQIITEVVLELLRDPEMKFTYVEMKYFNMWYTRQTKKMQEDVKNLITKGQLEITMGGWVGSEESVANYEDIIGNFYKGHNWIKNEFGVAPTIGWNVDPFGHTQANAAIFHDLGFEALFFARAGNDEIK